MHAPVLVSVQSEHESLQLSFGRVEPCFCKDVSEVARVNETVPITIEVIKSITHAEPCPASHSFSENFNSAFNLEDRSPEIYKLAPRFYIEEARQLCASRNVIVWPVGYEGGVLTAERKHSVAEFVEVDLATIGDVDPPEEHVNVIAAEIRQPQVCAKGVS